MVLEANPNQSQQRRAPAGVSSVEPAKSGLQNKAIKFPEVSLIAKSEGPASDRQTKLLTARELLIDLYGPRRGNLVRHQRAAGIEPSGRLDDATYNSILKTHAAALQNPGAAIKAGKALVAPGTNHIFHDEARRLLSTQGYRPQKLEGDGLFHAIGRFQRKNGLHVDGVAGSQTWPVLEKKAGKFAQSPKLQGGDVGEAAKSKVAELKPELKTEPKHEPKPVPARQAVLEALSYYKAMANSLDGFPILHADVDPTKPQNPQGVKVLQNLLRTIGYDQPMVEGVFDVPMKRYIVSLQDQFVDKKMMPPYQREEAGRYRMQLDRKSDDFGLTPGMVGPLTFRLLLKQASLEVGPKA